MFEDFTLTFFEHYHLPISYRFAIAFCFLLPYSLINSQNPSLVIIASSHNHTSVNSQTVISVTDFLFVFTYNVAPTCESYH